MNLGSPITKVKGVGAVLAEKLAALGINTVEDLVYFFPRRYDDYSQVVKIADMVPGKVTVRAKVESAVGRHVRRGLHITEAVIGDESSKVRAIWFNQSYRAAQLTPGKTYFFSGTYGLQRNRYVLQNPAAEQADGFGVSTARIVPIYPETRGLKSHQLRKLIRDLLPLMSALPESLPPELVKDYKLLAASETLATIHFPDDSSKLDASKRRVAFEELLWLITASLLNKQDTAKLSGYKVGFDESLAKQFVAGLPFKLTNAQRRAAWEMFKDLESGQPMNRLLQGDVGSGKTAVAAMLSFMVAKAGLQTAFMAPTEILASQHASTLAHLLQPLGLKVALLLGSTKAAAKRQVKDHVKAGDIDVVVGTHALIQKDSDFKKLGLVVVDEQHRFGVAQRSQLLTKGGSIPHLLSMTATPIPRSLQLTLYGELDISILDELPKGRQPVATKVVSPLTRSKIYEHIDSELTAGRQAYVVCPVISLGANAELTSVEAEYDRLTKSVFKHRRLGLLHGQLKPDEKEAIMSRFKKGEIDILICTTVVEVGVDVPNATIMLIEGAERFGLAQLHQLRGRVGRGSEQSYCYLVPTTVASVSQRLKELEQSTDGFYLAEADLRLRGPGEIYGRAQHGALDLNFVNLADTRLLKEVRSAAEWLVESQTDLLQYKRLHEHVDRYRRLTQLN